MWERKSDNNVKQILFDSRWSLYTTGLLIFFASTLRSVFIGYLIGNFVLQYTLCP